MEKHAQDTHTYNMILFSNACSMSTIPHLTSSTAFISTIPHFFTSTIPQFFMGCLLHGEEHFCLSIIKNSSSAGRLFFVSSIKVFLPEFPESWQPSSWGPLVAALMSPLKIAMASSSLAIFINFLCQCHSINNGLLNVGFQHLHCSFNFFDYHLPHFGVIT